MEDVLGVVSRRHLALRLMQQPHVRGVLEVTVHRLTMCKFPRYQRAISTQSEHFYWAWASLLINLPFKTTTVNDNFVG